MRAAIVYESMFGNNRAVAEAVARGLSGAAVQAVVHEAGAAPRDFTAVAHTCDLLIVGAPNHAFSLPRPATRADAAADAPGPLVSRGTGVREWLGDLRLPAGQPTAAWDTRAAQAKLLTAMDRASRGIERGLADAGGASVSPAAHFKVSGKPGPLLDGEVERAEAWGADLAARIARG